MRSFSEIETISKRASRGAGFSWGVSEEIGKSVRLLEMFGLPGIQHLKNYLEKINNQKIKDDLKNRTTAAYKKGVFGAPTFIVGSKMFFGQDRLEFVYREAKK